MHIPTAAMRIRKLGKSMGQGTEEAGFGVNGGGFHLETN
jgi:hypothetical protein